MTPADEGSMRVRLHAKKPPEGSELTDIAQQFAQDLLNADMRLRITRSTAELREQYTSRALFERHENTTIADLLAELDQEELDDEPPMIKVPWEGDKSD